MQITDYLGDTVTVPKPKASNTSISNRSNDMTRSYFTEGLKFEQPNSSEVEAMYMRWMATKNECFYCGKKTNNLVKDHLISNAHTGKRSGFIIAHNIHEFIPCCTACNINKGGKDPLEWYTDPDTISRLKLAGLSQERYAAKIDAMKYELEHLKHLQVSEDLYVQAEKDISLKNNMVEILEKMAKERNYRILQDNGIHVDIDQDELPTLEDREIWDKFASVLEEYDRYQIKQMTQKKIEAIEEPLF